MTVNYNFSISTEFHHSVSQGGRDLVEATNGVAAAVWTLLCLCFRGERCPPSQWCLPHPAPAYAAFSGTVGKCSYDSSFEVEPKVMGNQFTVVKIQENVDILFQ